MMVRGGCVYILTNKRNAVLYTRVTSDIITRVWQHKNNTHPNSFTSKYKCDKLVYYEVYHHIEEAIAAEKLIKGGSRQAKLDLISGLNPECHDLYQGLLDE